MLTELKKLMEKSSILGDARGQGLMIGAEIVSDKKTKEPSADLAIEIMEKLKDRWMLVGRGGAYGNVLRLQPPLCMSMDDAKYFIHHFGDIVGAYK